jgi:hypothetical protein
MYISDEVEMRFYGKTSKVNFNAFALGLLCYISFLLLLIKNIVLFLRLKFRMFIEIKANWNKFKLIEYESR